MKIELISGVEGNSLYLNDTRIAGSKPWGGGKVIESWNISKRAEKDISKILGLQDYQDRIKSLETVIEDAPLMHETETPIEFIVRFNAWVTRAKRILIVGDKK